MELHQLSVCYWIFSQVHVKSKETCLDSTQFCSVAQWSIKRFCWVTDTRIIRELESEFSLFTVAAVVFPKSVYLNIKSTRTVVIQNNYKKRFAIYPKTINSQKSQCPTRYTIFGWIEHQQERIMELRGILRSLARICEFHLSFRRGCSWNICIF